MGRSLKFLVPVLLSLNAVVAGCRSVSWVSHEWSGVLLDERPVDEATSVAWRLFPGEDGTARVHRTETRTTQVARLGVVTQSVTAALGERLGVVPWQGVHVRRVDRGSPAASAGLHSDDVILALAGTDITSTDQFRELVVTLGVPGEPIEIVVSGDGNDTRVVTVEPEPKDVTESKTDSFRLESSPGVQALTGMQVAVIPADLSLEIFERNEDVIVVAGVIVGSPAYLAGIRGGDRVLECDGAAVVSVEDVRRAVVARAKDLPVDAQAIEGENLAAAMRRADATGGEEPLREGDMDLRVDGALGLHRARVAVVKDLDSRSSFYIPIVIDYKSNAKSTRWSFLDFILQWGANYRSQYHTAATRAPSRSSSLSMLPFGMFKFEKGQQHRGYRLFWFISWRTRV